ncbi:hypothetical protein ACH41H_14285 [Streptomyces sp. NPDC020800]|uniref:hypothetical protein n=1 Tax=Streptomyces sp. NPDC020800 TaxID=3365092 RepID=UPI0037AD1B51
MGKPDTRRLDRAMQQAERKLEAVRNQEMWPLEGHERRAVLRAAVGGAYSLHRGNGTARADNKIDKLFSSAETRIVTEIASLKSERQRIVTEHAKAKAAKKSSGWW